MKVECLQIAGGKRLKLHREFESEEQATEWLRRKERAALSRGAQTDCPNAGYVRDEFSKYTLLIAEDPEHPGITRYYRLVHETPRLKPGDPCPRCSGTGLTQFYWVKNGVCFLCLGVGEVLDQNDREELRRLLVGPSQTEMAKALGHKPKRQYEEQEHPERERERAVALNLGFHPSELR